MKKTVLAGIITTVALYANNGVVSNEQKHQLDNFFAKLHLQVKKIEKRGDTFLLKVYNERYGAGTAIADGSLNTFIIGTAFNKKGEQIKTKENMKDYEKNEIYTFGNGKKDYYLFTDPECPFCQRFEKELEKRGLNNGIKVHLFLFPLPFHKDAKAMSRFVISMDKSKRAEAMKKILHGDKSFEKFKNSKKYDDIINKNIEIAKNVGVRGTPTLMDKNGKQVDMSILFKK